MAKVPKGFETKQRLLNRSRQMIQMEEKGVSGQEIVTTGYRAAEMEMSFEPFFWSERKMGLASIIHRAVANCCYQDVALFLLQ